MSQIPFYSKRNQVYPALWYGHAAVAKHFTQIDDWQRERELYALLEGKLQLPKVFFSQPGVLVLEFCSEYTLLEELERQEEQGFDPSPWQRLAQWLRKCHDLCGLLPEEGNLRNFLWNPYDCRIIGIDLECYSTDTLEMCGARLVVAILTYTPENTSVKRQIADRLVTELQVPDSFIDEALQAIRIRRSSRKASSMSGIVLAGGASRRMGQNKAELKLAGKTLLQHQVDKLHRLGILDIMLSGADCPPLPGVRVIPDEYTGKGPLGGLHACFQAAQNRSCLVIGVDTPLVPVSALKHLCRCHRKGVTVLRHGEREEPLIGVYDSSVASSISKLMDMGKYAVCALQDAVPWNDFDYLGPEELLVNCNTPEDFDTMKKYVEAYGSAFGCV